MSTLLQRRKLYSPEAVYSDTLPSLGVSWLILSAVRGLPHVTKSKTAFGDVFYKEPNTAYAEYVFGSAELTSDGRLPFNENMARFYPLIRTPPYLTAMPVITLHQRSSNDRLLIIASDGVWGIKSVTDEWAVKIVLEGIGKGVDPSEYLMEEVKKFHPGDDVTIMVIVFPTKQHNDVSDESID
jgi:serine/threonine protein phosphatase PrpC